MYVQRYYAVKSPLAKTDTFERRTGARFSKVSINNGLWTPLKAAFVYIQDGGFNGFPANTLKITVDKIKCTGSLGRIPAFKVPGGKGGGGRIGRRLSFPSAIKPRWPPPRYIWNQDGGPLKRALDLHDLTGKRGFSTVYNTDQLTPADHVISQNWIIFFRLNGGSYKSVKTDASAANPKKWAQREIMQQNSYRPAQQWVGHVVYTRHENNDCHQ